MWEIVFSGSICAWTEGSSLLLFPSLLSPSLFPHSQTNIYIYIGRQEKSFPNQLSVVGLLPNLLIFPYQWQAGRQAGSDAGSQQNIRMNSDTLFDIQLVAFYPFPAIRIKPSDINYHFICR